MTEKQVPSTGTRDVVLERCVNPPALHEWSANSLAKGAKRG